MTSFLPHAAAERSRGGTRWRAAAVLTCGMVLVPAASAAASHQRMSDGTLCPHAAEAAAAPAQPGQPAQPTRASSTAPLRSPGSTPASGSASRPASRAPAQRAVSRPATQVQAQQPASTASESGSASGSSVAAVSTAAVSTAAVAPKAQRKRAVGATPRAGKSRGKRAARRAGSDRVPVPPPPATMKIIDRPVTGTSAELSALPAPAVEPRRGVVPSPLAVALGMLAIAALGAAIVLHRRRRDGMAASTATDPSAPSDHDALIEAELHEIIAEATARALLADGTAEQDAAGRDLVRTP